MNILFSLVMMFGGQEYVLDFNMSEQDCLERMEAVMPLAPKANFECVGETSPEGLDV